MDWRKYILDSKSRHEWKRRYHEYLKSEQWCDIREQVLERDNYRCRLCCSEDVLHIHHASYDNIGDEGLGDLITLCQLCHEQFHSEHPSNDLRYRLPGIMRSVLPELTQLAQILYLNLFGCANADGTIDKISDTQLRQRGYRELDRKQLRQAKDELENYGIILRTQIGKSGIWNRYNINPVDEVLTYIRQGTGHDDVA